MLVRPQLYLEFMKKQKRIIGQYYPASTLVDYRTGKKIMIMHTEDSAAIRKMARESSRNLLKALADKTGLTPI